MGGWNISLKKTSDLCGRGGMWWGLRHDIYRQNLSLSVYSKCFCKEYLPGSSHAVFASFTSSPAFTVANTNDLSSLRIYIPAALS